MQIKSEVLYATQKNIFLSLRKYSQNIRIQFKYIESLEKSLNETMETKEKLSSPFPLPKKSNNGEGCFKHRTRDDVMNS
jgi:hypothetical protein